MTERENYLRAIEFRNPQWIPVSAALSPAVWKKYRQGLEDLVLRHPKVFGRYKKGIKDFDELPPGYGKGEYYRDHWGCLWYNAQDGLEGQVVESPLSDWKALKGYNSPEPTFRADHRRVNWEKEKDIVEERKRRGLLTRGDGERLFDRLYALRGFENLMIDFATDAPQLTQLIKMLLDYEINLVGRWLDLGVDIISFHSDIGTQRGLMINPNKFRRYIKPMLKEIFTLCRSRGTHVYFSSDGCILEIVDDLVECGVSLHDPQLRANTLHRIEEVYKGKICICLDLDRQMFPFCRPSEIREQIRDVVQRLGSPAGGLIVLGVFYGSDIPLQNIEAFCEASEEFCLADMPINIHKECTF